MSHHISPKRSDALMCWMSPKDAKSQTFHVRSHFCETSRAGASRDRMQTWRGVTADREECPFWVMKKFWN